MKKFTMRRDQGRDQGRVWNWSWGSERILEQTDWNQMDGQGLEGVLGGRHRLRWCCSTLSSSDLKWVGVLNFPGSGCCEQAFRMWKGIGDLMTSPWRIGDTMLEQWRKNYCAHVVKWVLRIIWKLSHIQIPLKSKLSWTNLRFGKIWEW